MEYNDMKVNIAGFDTSAVTLQDMAKKMVEDCKGRSSSDLPKLVFSSNAQGISLAGVDENFAKCMKEADIIHADGMSVVYASRLLSSPGLPERCATTDFFQNAAEAGVKNNLSFYILGGNERQNSYVVEKMLEMYPSLKIVGRHHGYFDESEEEEICKDIVSRGTDVLWVGLGKPKQEFWSVRNKERLRGVGWVKTCGGLYGYITGDEMRAPYILQKVGAEWLWRAYQSPKRLLWRYLTTTPHAIYCIVRSAISKRSSSSDIS